MLFLFFTLTVPYSGLQHRSSACDGYHCVFVNGTHAQGLSLRKTDSWPKLVVVSSLGRKTQGPNCLLILERLEPSQFRVHGSHSIIFKHTAPMRSDCRALPSFQPQTWKGGPVTTPLVSRSLRTLRAPGLLFSLEIGYKTSYRESSSRVALCPVEREQQRRGRRRFYSDHKQWSISP